MGKKVKNGGTIGRAPIGYMNVRRVDDKGREERTVVLDPERALLIKIAFEEYATGNWTVAELALMKSEQKKIAKELVSVEHEINIHNVTFENISVNLHLALDLIN